MSLITGKSKTPKYKIIAEHLRLQISKGRYETGDALPSQQSLMTEYGVSLSTVRQSIKELAVKGMVCAEHGRGLFVTDRTNAGEFAIVIRSKRLAEGVSAYHRLVCAILAEVLYDRYPGKQARLHTGGLTQRNGSFADTLDLLESHVLTHLSGVFALEKIGTLDEQLLGHGVPVVSLGGNYSTRYCVDFDNEILFKRGFEYLRKIGCRSIGVIGFRNAFTIGVDVMSSEQEQIKMLERGTNDRRIGDNGLDSVEDIGYQIMMRLIEQAERPDAIVVTDDEVCKGVLRAILQRGISLPNEIKLISHANRGVKLPYHLPVTRFEFDAKNAVQNAVEMMDKLLCGEKPEAPHVCISPDFILGDTA